MKYNKYFLIVIFITFFGCSPSKQIIVNDKLVSVINSGTFKKEFRICIKEGDTLKIYDNTNTSLNIPYFKIDCDKVIAIEKSNLKIDVNSSSLNVDDKVVLCQFERNKNKCEFGFLEISTNLFMVLSINENNKVSIISLGNF